MQTNLLHTAADADCTPHGIPLPDVDHEAFRKSFFARTDAEKIAEDRDTDQVSRLYTQLARLTGSPVVELNRAVAVAEAGFGS